MCQPSILALEQEHRHSVLSSRAPLLTKTTPLTPTLSHTILNTAENPSVEPTEPPTLLFEVWLEENPTYTVGTRVLKHSWVLKAQSFLREVRRFDGDGVANYGGGSDEDGEENDESDSKLPPHEFIARRLERSQISSFSVLEGAGRTLKGRDLSKVRNVVLPKIGFLKTL
ncbi:hypothetical protein JHK85_028165 [Glycine max]|nr:hypothetical protein JHK85_028165 [Glycine max]